MAEISEYLEVYTRDYLLEMALNLVSDDVDKREGSIIYDTLAIFSTKMADVFVEIKQIIEQAYIITATKKENIDYRVAERGITRYSATKAERLGVFTKPDTTAATIAIGSLFSTIDENKDNVINYEVVRQHTVNNVPVAGSYVLECQTEGTVGNTYYGEILPLTDMDTLGSATLTDVITSARDEEDNDSVKQRYFDTFNMEPFGGNFADYKSYMSNFSGVGQKQIYPRTSTDEKIVISCVDNNNQPISQSYINTIKSTLDPENYYNSGNNTEGLGLGVVPIGHKVTVMAPTEYTINVSVTIILSSSAYFPTVKQNIENSIKSYLNQIRANWDSGIGQYSSTIYYNRIFATAIDVPGVENVTQCLVNNSNQNIVLTHTRTTQYMPKIGTITVSEA